MTAPEVPALLGSSLAVVAATLMVASVIGSLGGWKEQGALVTPAPTPTPTPAPTAAAANTYSVPSSIDSTGASDASAPLGSFIGSVPNGSTIVFKAGGTYRLDRAIWLTARRSLVFDGNGSTLRMAGCNVTDSAFLLDSGVSDIVIRNFTMVGDNAKAGTSDAHNGACESQMGVALYGATSVEIANVTISGINGDCIYLDISGGVWPSDVWFHDSTCRLNGRMGVAIAAGSRVTTERVTFDKIAMYPLDIEPWEPAGGGTYVTFRNNTIGTYTIDTSWSPYLFAANGTPSASVHDLVVTGNRVTGGTLAASVQESRRRNIVFTNNTSTVSAAGPVAFFEHVDNVTVTGNVQPLSSGPLARFYDCTGVVAS